MLAFLASLATCSLFLPHEEKSFLTWMRSTNQIYTGDEYQLRLGIFVSNSRLIKEHNSKNTKFSVGLNKFAAYTPAEYKSLLGFISKSKGRVAVKTTRRVNADSLDWREKNVVNGVQNQGQCGSCWAFSAVQAVESADAIATGKLYKFSEQEIVDCVTSCSGCGGGLMTDAYDYVIKNQGGQFVLADDYKYKGVEGTCEFDKYEHYGSLSGYVNIVEGDEDDLCAKLQLGPVAVAIDASNWSFQLYTRGIYDEPSCSPSNLDHGVGLIGYGSEGKTKYWIVRNSWGSSWGEQGYIRMIWNNNQCGIATMATLPSP